MSCLPCAFGCPHLLPYSCKNTGPLIWEMRVCSYLILSVGCGKPGHVFPLWAQEGWRQTFPLLQGEIAAKKIHLKILARFQVANLCCIILLTGFLSLFPILRQTLPKVTGSHARGRRWGRPTYVFWSWSNLTFSSWLLWNWGPERGIGGDRHQNSFPWAKHRTV